MYQLDVKRFPLVSDQLDYAELQTLVNQLIKALDRNATGDVVELGCYEGTASVFIQRVLCAIGPSRAFHVYDSFEGLPEKTQEDNSPAGMQFKAGELTASKGKFIRNFKQANLPLPAIHKAWFGDLTAADLPDSIAFAFLDGDFYESIRTSLDLIESKLTEKAIIIIDDYQSESLPGASLATTRWLARHTDYKCQPEHSLAILQR